MEESLELRTEDAWKNASMSWSSPAIPLVIAAKTREERQNLGQIGDLLEHELAFMKFPEFQTYVNLENIVSHFPEDPQRGLTAVLKHEQGHRFCPYDTITLLLLNHAVQRELDGTTLPYDKNSASKIIVNLFTDMCLNTYLARKNDEDIQWVYQQISKDKGKNKLWRVYGKSMELAWDTSILPEGTELEKEEQEAAKELADIFGREVLDKRAWKDNIKAYARIISKFLENEQQDQSAALSNIAENIPKKLDEKTSEELAKRLAEIGSDGLPTNHSGLREFKEVMAGFGQGDATQASISFYEMLSRAYDVMFATRPFGRPRTSPFQPEKWHPSMGPEAIDVQHSIQLGGKLIPGITTYTWKSRKREIFGGLEEVVPNLDIYIDSSGSMPNPLEEISLPVLAGFVAAKKAHRKGAKIRATNFSGNAQFVTQEWTRDLDAIYKTLVIYYGGGTIFPSQQLLGEGDPKQVLVITDTFLYNKDTTTTAITDLLRRNAQNRITIYALHQVAEIEDLKNAGAEVIQGTTPDIFRKVIGKAHEAYTK